MTASDLALTDMEALKAEIIQIQARLHLLAESHTECLPDKAPWNRPKAVAALERAAAWLGDITAPLTPEEEREWSGDPSDEDDRGVAGSLHDAIADDKPWEIAETVIDNMCDADKRSEIENEREWRDEEAREIAKENEQ